MLEFYIYCSMLYTAYRLLRLIGKFIRRMSGKLLSIGIPGYGPPIVRIFFQFLLGIFRQQRIEAVLIAVYGRIEPAGVQRFQALLLDGIRQFARKHRDILVRFPYPVGVGKAVMYEKTVRVRRQPIFEYYFRAMIDKMTEVFIISPVCRYSLCFSLR